MKVLKIALIAMLAIGIAACSKQQLDDSFTIVCASVSIADQGFQIYVSTGKVTADVIEKERLAVQAAQAACNGPRPQDVSTAVAYIQRIISAIIEATAQARKQAGG